MNSYCQGSVQTDGVIKMLAYMKNARTCLLLSMLIVSAVAARASVISTEQIRADWLRQMELRSPAVVGAGKVTVASDAAGGVDGVINGKWGFHTAHEPNPWWQVDLEKIIEIDRVVLYNRTELAARNSRIILLVSNDGKDFRRVYQHNGTVFAGYADGKPLDVKLANARGRFLRLQLPSTDYFHLDEVQLFAKGSDKNIALNKPATQSSTSQWSVNHSKTSPDYPVMWVVETGLKLADDLQDRGVNVDEHVKVLRDVAEQVGTSEEDQKALYFNARSAVRKMAFKNPLLDFDRVLFVKRAPGMFPHMSDQYYGWWSRPGGGIYILENFKTDTPTLRCLTEDWPAGNFLRPDLSYDGTKVIFAWCKYYPHVADMEKVDKSKLPEDVFYSIYEMDIDGGGCRQLTRGKYDDFDARYLPNGDIIFLSTRKGTSLQVSKASAAATCNAALPDSYVRCGGGNVRPVPVFTLHAMNGDGADLRAISAFENFEWTPAIAHDGRIIYARWDYIDRFNGHFMSLWSSNQDGANAHLVYGNYTTKPQCIFEARSIPDSNKLVFTAASHHSNMGGSICLLDRTKGAEYESPLTRLTPEVPFPEAEKTVNMYYANPWPLSEDYFLVAWSDKRLPPHSRVENEQQNPSNATGIYLYDAFGNLELLHRDAKISGMYPIPIRPRPKPAEHPSTIDWDGPQQGSFLVQNVYLGLGGIAPGSIKRLRVIGVPPKVQPHMNQPSLGVSREDPGKFVLGTVPVEKDGSAYFGVPSGISIFFHALDADGLAVQTMRSLTYVQPNQTLACIGCHEPRDAAPLTNRRPIAALRPPSKLTPGPEGSWPLRFDTLVQPVLNNACIRCHCPKSTDENAHPLDLTAKNAYQNLLTFAENNLEKLAFEKDRSQVGDCPARRSKLLALLTTPTDHQGIRLTKDQYNRLTTWMDTYAQRQGSFSPQQEKELKNLRHQLANLLTAP
ncbi:MAG: discoidin domain-containing protein [Planctomycetes bacterium]|nr:discoidin domain-containing protein [Planctomycetota bacterium]